MKLLAFILTFFMLFLAVKPGIDSLALLEASEQTCCGSQCTPSAENESTENNADDCEGKSCNPFQVCSTCVLVCMNMSSDALPKPTAISTLRFNYQLRLTSQYAPDFWQPPKIV